jgi:hypothetical protein
MTTLAGRYAVEHAPIVASSSGDNTIVSAVTGRRIVVVNFEVVNAVATAQAITWKSGASTSRTGAMALASSIGVALGFVDSGVGLFETALGGARC